MPSSTMLDKTPGNPKYKRGRLSGMPDRAQDIPESSDDLRTELDYLYQLNQDYEELIDLTTANVSQNLQHIASLDSQILQVKIDIEEAITCTMCEQKTSLTTAACGHSYCNPCWLAYFTSTLKKKLSELEYLSWQFQRVPLSQPELRYLVNNVVLPADKKGLCEYPCPLCRHPIASQPVSIEMNQDLVHRIRSALALIHADGGLDYEEEDTVGRHFFKAVFLTSDNDVDF